MGQAIFAKVVSVKFNKLVFLAIASLTPLMSVTPKEVQAGVMRVDRPTVDRHTDAQPLVRPRQIAQFSSPMVDPDLIAANTRFSFKLFSELLRQDGVDNVTVAPASVAIALSMTYNGASGETQRAMAQTLELQGMSLQEVNQSNAALQQSFESADPQVQLAIANSLWCREGTTFNSDFLRRNQDFYQAEITSLNFASPDALSTINGWVNRNTQGRIPEILSRVNRGALLYLINAIYFKGNWTRAFDPSDTANRPFYLLNGTSKQHPLMSQRGSYFYLENAQFQAINLPYGNERFSMYVFLPRSGSTLNAFLQTLTADNWGEWTYQFTSQSGSLQLPRFKLSYDIELSNVLKAIGMANAFDGSRADFSEISNQRTAISIVQHKTFIEVNEEGTEAAASTAIGISRSAAPVRPPFEMIVDRPFFYAIQDNETGQILFMGTVVDPQV